VVLALEEELELRRLDVTRRIHVLLLLRITTLPDRAEAETPVEHACRRAQENIVVFVYCTENGTLVCLGADA
jgi:hypothetical protein